MKTTDINFDIKHIWHPYTSIKNPIPTYPIIRAKGVELELANGNKIIDGIASWWSVIHGYNHPILNQAAIQQIKKMSHVMFGGITHQPAINLCKQLIDITSQNLECIFLADSASISVEIALKMAIQYWEARNKPKHKFLALQYGYHGDTFGAMSVCDPINSMHHLYKGYLPTNLFAKAPQCGFYEQWNPNDIIPLEKILDKHANTIAAIIIEPILQAVGGMRIYNPNYLVKVKELCDYYNILLIVDEIATGFGRTGKLFAYEHSKIMPDILCLGKALTGGYVTLSATITTRHIANTISQGKTKCFMHGPTFMGNPLACAIANASITLLRNNLWKELVKNIETQLQIELSTIQHHPKIIDIRVLGAIGIIEMNTPIDIIKLQHKFVNQGIWLRPFNNLIYLMPSYIITSEQLTKLTDTIKQIIINE